MNVTQTSLSGVLILEPKVFGDSRGYFLETWNRKRYESLNIPPFVQDNTSFSPRGVLRGLHYQVPMQGKLVQVLSGAVFDVAVDLRTNSSTFGKWVGVELSSENHRQLWIPTGFAHGFYVLQDAVFSYKCTDYYASEGEVCIAWNDPDLDIEWPIRFGSPRVSDKDKKGIEFADLNIKYRPDLM